MADSYVSLTKQDPFYEGIKRRQKYAEMLAKQGAEDIKVEDVGGIPTPISPFQGLAKVFQTGLGAYLGNQADKDEAASLDARREKVAKALAGMPSATTATGPSPTDATAPVRVTFNQKRNYLTDLANSPDPDIAEAGAKRLKTLTDSMGQMAKVNPSQYTKGSVNNYMDTGDYSDLVAKPTGLKGDLYDMFDLMGFDVKTIANSPLAQRLISGLLAKSAGLITEEMAADLGLKFVNAGVTRAAELRANPTGEDVPPMPGQETAFSIKPYLNNSNAIGQPAPTTPLVYTLPPQPTAQPPVVPRLPMNQPPGGAPMRQAAPTAPATMPNTQAPPTAAPQQGGAPMFGWQEKGFVPLVLDQTISPMKRQDLKFDQPTNEKSVRTSVGQLDSWAKAGVDLLNDPGFERISGLVGSNLKDISKEAISASAKYKQIENIAKGFSVQSMKEASKTGATSLGQITMGEYPMLRDMAGLFLSAGTAPAKRAALSDFVNKLVEIRNNKLGEYNSTYPALSYQPPAYAPFGGIKQPRSEADNQETLDLINQYHKGR